MMMIIGYARVSTEDQNLELQLDALRLAGCERLYTDKASGSRIARPGLDEAMASLKRGDRLIVWKLDRLGRSVKHLVELASRFKDEGIDLKSVSDGIDTSSSTGRFFFHVMSAFAEMERELIRERTNAGLAAAKDRGRTGGRPKSMTTGKVEAVEKLLRSGMPISDVARSVEVSVPTIYRYFPAAGKFQHPKSGVKA
jgi:DNA invertase Pin-like site-specific DNA recombinase